MEKAKFIFITLSLVFDALCFGASAYFSCVLPDGDPNLPTFYIMTFVFGISLIWFSYNAYNLYKSNKK